ncbi:TonB-dependent receptor plug domain-containing protein [Microbulbifer marinus]|uniref:TonB-dependent Receptor Plug Domain n=1 Tax=Microbulbifer marinus TaxID=658218 RepID=A0A1H4BDB3_9GAMM|nr:TonB-dependent receptor [Microbulbifer marinus]SEA46097.1 TonB-dependent Receptor Plug Domain [Microbulbifer marinus]
MKRNILSSAIKAALGISVVLGPCAQVLAQESVDGNEAAQVEEVVVTGSRIIRANLESATPITTVDSQTIEFSGELNSADILRSLPATGVSALSSNNSNFFTSGGGINTVELRNLGEDRTLTLVNGRRYVSGVMGSSAVDWNTIPTELIERVEVITGGASAIYGSDALAGVINVILKDDYEGVSISSSHGETLEFGDDTTDRFNLTAGGNFDDGKGNAVVSMTYTDEGGVYARDRKNTRVDDIASCYFTDDSCQTSLAPFYSSYSESGRFWALNDATKANYTYDDGVVAWDPDEYGFNRQQFRRYSVPTERFLVSSNLNYEITDSLEAFVETTFARTETQTELEPYPLHSDDLFIDGISIENPYVPQELRDVAMASGDEYIQFVRRTTELEQRGSFAERQTYRALIGLRGEFNDWNWDAFLGQGQMQDSQRGTGQLNISNFRNALNVIEDADGNIVCADPAAVAEGCAPINLFGKGSISPEAADYVSAPSVRDQRTKQTIAGINLNGTIVDLPAGPLSLATGWEYRDEYAADFPDALTRTGQNAGNKEEPTEGSFDVNEVYVEMEAPIVADLPLVQSLSVGAAYRYSDYNTIGDTDAYTGRVNWVINDSLRVRGQYARAVRAPNINELFAPGGENFANVSDPCDGVTATTSGVVAENCRSNPAVAARIESEGVFELTQPELQGTGGFTSKGNENLFTETSDSYTLGAVFDQDLGDLGSLTVSLDWYSIEIEDLIDTVDRQTSVDFCYNSTSFPNNFCDFVVRDTSGPDFQQGEITEVNSGYINEGSLKTEGIDLQLMWGLAVGQGQLDMKLNYGHVMKYDQTKFGETDELVGEIGYFDDQWVTTINYALDRFMVQLETTYLSDAVPDVSSDYGFSTGEYVTHDLFASYQFTDSISANLGVNNLLDEEAPIILSGIPGNTTGTDTNASVYNPIGRSAFVGVRMEF